MAEPAFEKSAGDISIRNLTDNVAAVAATWDAATGHMHVLYYLKGPPEADDELLRERTVAELLEAYPAIRSASSEFGAADELESEKRSCLVFARDGGLQ